MALERVEVAERWWAEDRGAEGEILDVDDGVVVIAWDERLDEVRQRGDAQAAAEVVVERRHRLPVQCAVVGEVRVRCHRPATRDLEVDPARAAGIERRREAPVGPCGGVVLPDVGDTHRPSLAKGAAGPDRLRQVWISQARREERGSAT